MSFKMVLLCLAALFLLIMFSQAAKAFGGKGKRSRARTRPQSTPTPTMLATPALGRTYQETLQSGGLARTYMVYTAGSYDGKRAVPLVLVLHGGGGKSVNMNKLTHFNDVADKEGFIIAYPDGISKSWADGRDTRAGTKGVDDVGFLSGVIDAVSAKWKIDAARVYVTGISNGGFMTQRLACELSDKIAAAASVASTISKKIADQRVPTRPVPMLFIFGDKDPLVPIGGGEVKIGAGGQILPLKEAVQKWVDQDGCISAPMITDMPNLVEDGTYVTRTMYSPCDGKAEVVLYLIQGGGHTWPGGLQYLPPLVIGKTNRDIDASKVIWEFFKQHSLD